MPDSTPDRTAITAIATGQEVEKAISPVLLKAAAKHGKTVEQLMDGLSPESLYWAFALNFQRVVAIDAAILEKAERYYAGEGKGLNAKEQNYLNKVRAFYGPEQWAKMKDVHEGKDKGKKDKDKEPIPPQSLSLAALILELNRGSDQHAIIGQVIEGNMVDRSPLG